MKIIKKLNNNIVLALNDQNEELIVRGKGLGFEKIPYFIPENHSRIEAIYVPSKNIKAAQLIEKTPEDICELTKKMVQEGEKILKQELNANIYLTLADHISYVLERYADQLEIKNPFHWEIKNIYPEEYRAGLKCLDIVQKEKGICLPEVEASFIALHFVNALLLEKGLEDANKLTKVISEIVNIIKYHYQIDLDEDSMAYNRFVTHIRYFVIRQMNHIDLKDSNKDLFKMIKEHYIDEMDCVSKITHHLKINYGWNCGDDEMLYLVLHIQRLKNCK